jgi:two-component system chemotaxis response regulator CheB
MGTDGTEGASRVRCAGGRVLVARPGSHVAAGMPGHAIRAGVASSIEPLERLGHAITRAVETMTLVAAAG